MKCPCCGEEMNCHAEKLTEPLNAEEAKKVDPALGGIIEQAHTCPQCGTGDSRRLG